MAHTLSLFDYPALDRRAHKRPSFHAPPQTQTIRARDLIRAQVLTKLDQEQPHPLEALYATKRAGKARTSHHSTLQVRDEAGKQASIARALRAFQRGDYLLLVDNQHIQSLDKELTLHNNSSIDFIRLVPLAGH